jgi:hypothetical protein
VIYTLKFIGKFGLWELRINNFRIRFFCERYGAERLIERYRRAAHGPFSR